MDKAADLFVGGGCGSQRMRQVGWGLLEQSGGGEPQSHRNAGDEGGGTVFRLWPIGNSLSVCRLWEMEHNFA